MIGSLFNSLHLYDFNLRAAVEVFILSFVVYRLLLLIKGTRAVQMVYGIIGLLFITWLAGPSMFGLTTIHQLLLPLLSYIPFVIIVVFQNTIRRALTGFGIHPLGRYLGSGRGDDKLGLVTSAAYALAARRIGGLIVLEREQGLRNWTESGITLDAAISYDLMVNVFSPYTPLHDGALVIGDGRLKAASCFLPLTNNPALSTKYGTRHRAAVGITEETDAVSIVISEERGTVSLVINGVIFDALEKPELRHRLESAMEPILRHKSPKEKTATPPETAPADGAPPPDSAAAAPALGGPEEQHGS
ncbi:MAG: diadenylate cyclase [Acidobacteriota bacterium]